MDDITRTPEHEAISALRPFAMYADSMRSLHDDDRIGSVYVRHFREAARVVNEYDAVCFGCAPSEPDIKPMETAKSARDDKYCEAAQQFAAAWEAGKSLEYCAGILEERLAPSAGVVSGHGFGGMLESVGPARAPAGWEAALRSVPVGNSAVRKTVVEQCIEAIQALPSHGGDSEGLRHCECRFNAQGVIVDECGYHLGARLNATATRLRDILHSARIAPSSTRSKADGRRRAHRQER